MWNIPETRRADDAMIGDAWSRSTVDVPEEAEFERLVTCYGPMVLRTTRDILGDDAAAEDAFQATFLVLFRQAGTIRDRASVGRWLHEVACRIARRAQGVAAKRRAHERQGLAMAAVSAPDHEMLDREWRPILHEEIQALPVKLREAIVLCYLNGMTVEAAARHLDCPPGTLKSRLSKGRELLKTRLTRRGLAASICGWIFASQDMEATGAVTPGGDVTNVPPGLIYATVKIALGDLDSVPCQVQALAKPESSSRRPSVLKLTLSLLFLFILLGATRWSMAVVPESLVIHSLRVWSQRVVLAAVPSWTDRSVKPTLSVHDAWAVGRAQVNRNQVKRRLGGSLDWHPHEAEGTTSGHCKLAD